MFSNIAIFDVNQSGARVCALREFRHYLCRGNGIIVWISGKPCVITLALSTVVLSAIVSFTASNTHHSSQYMSRGKSINKELHSKHDARLRMARSPKVNSVPLLAQAEPLRAMDGATVARKP